MWFCTHCLSSTIHMSYTCLFLLGTASAAMWTLRAEGRLFHSGLPHKVDWFTGLVVLLALCLVSFLKGINSLELADETIAYLQRKFYADFPPVNKICSWKFFTKCFVTVV